MRNFIAGLFVGFAILAMFYFLFDGISLEQERREIAATQCDRALEKIEQAKVGKHIRVNGVGLLKTSHHAGRVEK